MTDFLAAARRPVDNGSGEAAMSRLADRLASMAPPLDLTMAQVDFEEKMLMLQRLLNTLHLNRQMFATHQRC